MRTALLFSILLTAFPSVAKEPAQTAREETAAQRIQGWLRVQDSFLGERPDTLVAQACCKVCRKGQACGNSCISWDKTCHKPPGCACQG